jgi:ubiquinone/menaquinone biosynthesis C-methylase UbiE
MIEEIYVKKTYDRIAKDFDTKRYRPWSCVEKFLDSIPNGARVAEIGCGNGKNMLYRNDLKWEGCDFSKELVKICKIKKLNVKYGNILDIPYNDNSFEYTLCVAVLHHLSTPLKIRQAIKELVRITKRKGKIFILVWSFEQDESSKVSFTVQDNYINWKNKIGTVVAKRYYHVFRKNELELRIRECECPIEIEHKFYEKGNWGVILKK